jgi:hypothetical protein
MFHAFIFVFLFNDCDILTFNKTWFILLFYDVQK